jgi:pimeloyl-ACP methyl ester carboxylesterase
MTCVGEGEPAVVLVSGLHTGGHTFADLARELGTTTQVCSYDRAGIGDSPPLPAKAPDPSAGSAADDLARTLSAEGIAAPYVVVGWSYGGMVTQAFATRHADLVAGIVLEDSSVPDQFSDPYFGDTDWVEGGRIVNKAATIRQLKSVDFGDVPLGVLTQGEASGEFGRLWHGYQNRLAGLSTDSVHVEAVQSGHEIHAEAQALELSLIREVVEAVRSGHALPACDNRFDRLQGHCL